MVENCILLPNILSAWFGCKVVHFEIRKENMKQSASKLNWEVTHQFYGSNFCFKAVLMHHSNSDMRP